MSPCKLRQVPPLHSVNNKQNTQRHTQHRNNKTPGLNISEIDIFKILILINNSMHF